MRQRPIDEPEAPSRDPLAHVEIRGEVGDVVVKRTFAGCVEGAILVIAAFDFAKNPPVKPTFGIGVMIGHDVSNAHQDRKLWPKAVQMIEELLHLHIPVTLRGVRVQMQRHRAK